jgi:hypothetical protein
MKIESSFSGESTFLKKDRMLVLGFTGVLAGVLAGVFVTIAFFVLCFACTEALDLELGREVSGLLGLLGAIVELIKDVGWGNALLLSGGVGGLPIEGFSGGCKDWMAACRGFLNISTHHPLRNHTPSRLNVQYCNSPRFVVDSGAQGEDLRVCRSRVKRGTFLRGEIMNAKD